MSESGFATRESRTMARNTKAEQAKLSEVEQVGRPADVVKLEKNLNYISFFSPSKSRRGKTDPATLTRVRTISYPPREVEGKTVHPKTTIKPDPQLGLPTTADRDKYMAFMKIVTDRKAKLGTVQNPIGFTTYELLKYLGLTDAGYHYEEVNQFLERMVSTTIKSEYAVYFHGTKKWAKDIFHVFSRVVLTGQEMPDGTVAQMNHVYLSDWQLENINSNYTFPIDFASYRRLKRDIAKALFGHLHTWFYASRGRPVERKYSDLCSVLDIQRWPHLSKARQILQPPLDELIGIEYFQSWELIHTADHSDFKLVLVPGERILQITRPRLGEGSAAGCGDPQMEALVAALVQRGVREADARRTLFDVDFDRQSVMDQIEWFDEHVRKMGAGVLNPPGFLLTAIRENWPVPAGFESVARRQLQERLQRQRQTDPAAAADAQRALRRMEVEEQYRVWTEEQIHAAIGRKYTREQIKNRVAELKKIVLLKHPGLYAQARNGLTACPALEDHAMRMLREEVRQGLALPSLESFAARPQQPLF
jgi:hypothetical protein